MKIHSEGNDIQAVEKIFFGKDGKEIPVSFSSTSYKNESGVVVGFVCSAQNISDLKSAREQLLHAQKLKSIGKLAGGIAHDFNNMLAGISGNLELLKLNLGANPGKDINYICAAEKSAKRSSELVQQLLGFARKGKYQKVPLNLNDIILETKSVLLHTLDKMINVIAVPAPDLWEVQGDSSQLFQALMNLGLNARDAMPNGGELSFESKNLTADAHYCRNHEELSPGEYVCIMVSDTGLGIRKNKIEKIFEPFYTTKEVGKGAGLGLSVVYGIIKNHSGIISVYSENNKGTTFYLYLPRYKGKTTDQFCQKDIGLIHSTKENIQGKKILIVDDEEVIRNVVKEILEIRGMCVTITKNGEEAISFYKSHTDKIDIVILDIVMPIMDGPDIYRALKEINPEVKIIFASGYTESDRITKIIETEDMVRFIQKPFNANELVSLINQVLRE